MDSESSAACVAAVVLKDCDSSAAESERPVRRGLAQSKRKGEGKQAYRVIRVQYIGDHTAHASMDKRACKMDTDGW